MPKISICIPFYFGMKNWQFFLTRCLESIERQTFKDYEIVLIKYSTMPITSNRVIESAKGEIIKVLYMDDWLEDNNYLQTIYRAFEEGASWVITSATTNLNPHLTGDIEKGNNKLGSPSALAFTNRRIGNLMFDENLSWLLDVDLYKRMYVEYGDPTILTNIKIGIGVHDGQMTNMLTDEEKLKEHNYLQEKYG